MEQGFLLSSTVQFVGENRMADMELLYKMIDELPSDALNELSRYLQQRQMAAAWEVPTENIRAIEKIMKPAHELIANMREDAINEAIDAVTSQVERR
jgi:hypothetical protein